MSDQIPDWPAPPFVFEIDGFKTLPLYVVQATTITEFHAYGRGSVQIQYRDPEYVGKSYDATSDWLSKISNDPDAAKELIKSWETHKSNYIYYLQFRNDARGEKANSLHGHTALVSAMCDNRVKIDTSGLWRTFDDALHFGRVHSDYRADERRQERYEQYAGRVTAAYTGSRLSTHEDARLLHRIIQQIDLQATIWQSLPPLQHSLADSMTDVVTELKWDKLAPKDFERLLFSLISSSVGYEYPTWLTHTNAPDDGRDLSVFRVYSDKLAGTKRLRGIIACKHWTSKSVDLSEAALLKEQMKLWEPPRVDFLVLATSGRFTTQMIR